MANITLGQTINESLSSTDTKNPKKLGSFSDDYTLSGFSNWQQVQVNLDSTAIDSYLQLVNASTGAVIADNDDLIQGNKNSQLKFTVVPGVNYAIRATSLNANETGNYTIKTSSLGIASSLVLIRGTGEVGTVDPLGRFVKIETFVESIGLLGSFDIVLSNDNKILGFTSADDRNQLYSLDPGSDSSSLIGNFPVGVFMDALEFLPNGTLYGVTLSSRSGNNTELYTINPQNGTLSSIANFPMDGNPAVDMVFEPVNNRFLLVESRLFTSTLSSVSLTGQYTKIGDIGFNNVEGLSLEGSTLVGFTRDQKRIIIDPATGKGTFDRDITGITGGNGSGIIGAGSIPSATRTQAPTPPTPTPPTPTPTPTLPTPTPTPTPTVLTPTPTPTPTPTVPTRTPTPTPTPTVLTPTPTPTPTPTVPTRTPTPTPTPTLTPTPTPTQTPTPTPTPTPTLTLPTTPAATNNTGGAAKSIYNAKDINKNYPDTNPVSKATIRIWQLGKDGKPEQNPTQLVENKETYVVIHGFKNDSTDTATIAELAKQIGSPKDQGGEGKQVILIDWKDAAEALQPAFAAEWISDVAAFASDVLKRIWKIDNANINLIGHSLGTLVASEIGLDLGTEDKDVLNSEYRRNPNIDPAKRINTLIALDPPGDATTIPFIGYDLSKERNGTQSPVDFNKVSNFSRAFWGSLLADDGLGKPEFAATADESIYVDFKLPEFNLLLNRDQQNPLASHGNIVNLFNNLLKSNDNIGSLFQLNTPKHTEWQEDAFGKNEAVLTATARFMLENDPNTKPILLFAKDANRQNNDIIYGGVGDNTGDNKLSSESARKSFSSALRTFVFNYPQINSPGSDKIYGNSGNDEIFGLTGNDTIYGGKGNDTIYGEQDNDIIFGGDNQDIIWGGKGDDTINGGDGNDTLNGDDNNDVLIGGAGSDLLNGGFGDDVLYGGTDKDQDTLIGGLGNTTFLLGLDNGLPVTKDKRNRDKVDIIEDFRAGILFGFGRGPDIRGISAIGLINGLKADQIVVETFGEGLGGLFNQKTAIIANGQYLAVLNGEWFNKADLRLTEIPNLVL
jgi:pimeloyl-ACP methyl ester carboxylesterase